MTKSSPRSRFRGVLPSRNPALPWMATAVAPDLPWRILGEYRTEEEAAQAREEFWQVRGQACYRPAAVEADEPEDVSDEVERREVAARIEEVRREVIARTERERERNAEVAEMLPRPLAVHRMWLRSSDRRSRRR